jgi:sugar phosphate isomerase/epimerase
MILSFATANLYQLPFEEVLALIVESGYEAIELDLYWERKQWAMAQHLRGVSPQQIAKLIQSSGLRVASIHDGGGVLEGAESTAGYINPVLDAVLDATGAAPECIVFHTPHVEGLQDSGWWGRMEERIAAALLAYRERGFTVTVENTPPFDGYTVPLTRPAELAAFAGRHQLGVTLDTTHYAQMGVNVLEAAHILRDHIRSVHLSDFLQGKAHVFVGEGELDLPAILSVLIPANLTVLTIECSLARPDGSALSLNRSELVDRLIQARWWAEERMLW